MRINLMNKTTILTGVFLLLFVFSANIISAQNVPNPPAGNGPQFPNQPEVPPCALCDEFSVDEADPTPSPSAIVTPSPDPESSDESTGEVLGTTDTNENDEEDSSIGGQVLALSATSAEESNFVLFTLLGLICISLGTKIYHKVSKGA